MSRATMVLHRKSHVRRTVSRGLRAKVGKMPNLVTANNFRKGNGYLTNKLQGVKLGSTAAGSEFVRRSAHPCDDTLSGGVPIPDASESSSANIEIRHLDFIGAPTGETTARTWDIQILTLALPDVAVVYRKKFSDKTNWNYWHSLPVSGQTIAPGTTKFLGAITTLNGGWEEITKPSLVATASSFRQSYRGLTIVPNMSSISNQGFVISGQINNLPSVQSLALNYRTDITDDNDANRLDCVTYVSIPDNNDQLMSVCPDASTWEAKKGVYMPMHFVQPTHLYNEAVGATYVKATTAGREEISHTGYPIVLGTSENTTNDNVNLFSGLIYPDSANLGSPFLTTAGVVNSTLGVVIMSGISNDASLEVKTRSGLEFVPKPGSAAAPFITEAPLKDQMALDMAQALQKKLPGSFPHRYNSLGALLPMIMSVGKQLLPHILPQLMSFVSGKLQQNFQDVSPSPSPVRRRAVRYVDEDVD